MDGGRIVAEQSLHEAATLVLALRREILRQKILLAAVGTVESALDSSRQSRLLQEARKFTSTFSERETQ